MNCLLLMLMSDIQRRLYWVTLYAAIMLLILGFTPIEELPKDSKYAIHQSHH